MGVAGGSAGEDRQDMGERSAGIWRFGAVELDERQARLCVDGRPVALDRSSYDILLVLLRHGPEVVTKDELLEAGWPDRIVTENSLAKAVGRLRRALGGDAHALRVVHGYGYRLATSVTRQPLPPVETVAAAPDVAHLHPGDPLPHRPGWHLVRRVGEGAAGVIWLAQGGDGEHRAVKFAAGEAGVRSLRREIALARYLRSVREAFHGVMPVLGWQLGEPPFFLELPWYADGCLRDWAATRGGLRSLPRAERMALCIEICEAVANLHEVGVIHRDLKPGNIYPLADARSGKGRGVVLGDLGAGDTTASLQLAATGITMSLLDTGSPDGSPRYPGSLLYIAPEVLAGEVPSQRSDVFALGVLAFQLAVGDLRSAIAPGWEAEVGDPLLCEDIRLAATANPALREIDARGLAERLRSLDARREQQAAERQRALEMTRQATALARMTRRRRWLLGGTAMLGIVLVVSLWQQRRIDHARALAEAAAATAMAEGATTRAVVAFLTHDLLQQADPYATDAGPQTMREALDRAARGVDQRFADRPHVAAAIHGTLGRAYEGLNDYDRAVAHFERQVEALRSVQPPDAAAIAAALASQCTAQHWQGDLARVWTTCNAAREAHLAAGLEPDRPEVYLSLADSRESHYRDALDRLAPRLPRIRESGDRDLLGDALLFAAVYTARLGELEEHERLSRELLDVRRSEGDSMDHAWALTTYGNALLLLGRDDAGLRHLEEAHAMFRRVGGEDHPHAFAPRVRLAEHLARQGRWEEALAVARPTYEFLLEKTDWQNWTVYAALLTMEAEARLGRRDEALSVVEAFDAMASQGMDRDFPYLREAHWQGKARTWIALGDMVRAGEFVERLRPLAGGRDSSPALAGEVACLDGEIALALGDRERALEHAGACRTLLANAVPAGSGLLQRPAWLLRALGI